MRKARIAQIVAVAAAVPVLLFANTGSAFADGQVTWQNDVNGLCLAHTEDVWGNPDGGVAMRGCDYAESSWHDVQQSDGSYIEQVSSDHSYCLAAYTDHSVYVEKCTANNDWQHFWEDYDSSVGAWRLHHKPTGMYVTDYDRGTHITVDYVDPSDHRQMWH